MSARYLGDFTAGKTIRGRFNSVSGTTGAPITLAGTPTLAVYKDGGTTESTAGVTLTVDFDARTGMHFYAIDTSADGTFYSAGSDFTVALTAGTVGGTSVAGAIVGAFSLANRSGLRPTVADRTLDVSSGGEAGIDWANVGSPTTALNLSGTSTKALEPSVAGRTLDVTVNGNAGIDWANIEAPTTAVNLSGTTISTSQAIASVSGTVAALGSGSITSSTFAAGAINAAAIAADAIGASELAADAVAEIADAVWDEVLSGHLTAGSTGNALNAAGSAGDPWSTTLPGAYGAGTAGNIIGNRLDAAVSTRSTYAGGDTSGTTTLLSRLTSTRAGYLDNLTNLDAAISTRSTYAGADTSGTATLLTRLSATRAGYLDNLSGGPVALASGVTVTGTVNLNLAQTLSSARNVSAVADTSLTLNDALHLAIAGAAGQETVVGTAYTIKTPSTATVLRVFTLDSGSAPTQRT